jgi:hypothetical protein
MNKCLTLVLALCGLLSACSDSSSGSIPLSPDCQRSFDVATAYMDKLEATGRFSPEMIDCYRRLYAKMKAGQQDPAIRRAAGNTQEAINDSCRIHEQLLKAQMIKADEIPNLSQEEFDADWGRITCPGQK